MSQKNMKSRRVTVMGFRAVGKSSLTIQYCEQQFVEHYSTTIENTFHKVITVKGQDYNVDIIDTAGQDEFSIFPMAYSIGIHGYILVYSVASRTSFNMVRIIRDKLLNLTGNNNVPMVLVGNKIDLHMDRVVSTEEGQALATEWGCAFVEASARHNQSVSNIFVSLLLEIEKAANPGEVEQKKGCIIS
eukprot:Colp12_sorted_trinity150504_noHs@7599